MSIVERRITLDYGEAGKHSTALGGDGSLYYRVVDVNGNTLVARTNVGIHPSPLGKRYYAVISNWDTAWSGEYIFDDGVDDFGASFLGDQNAGSGPYAVTFICKNQDTLAVIQGVGL